MVITMNKRKWLSVKYYGYDDAIEYYI